MLSPGAWGDRQSLETRLLAMRVFAIVCFGLLLVSFWLVQVVQNARYETLADNNYLRTIPLRAPRGLVFDRNDRVLVENRDSFMITLVRERSANLDQTLALLASVTGVDEAAVREIVQRHRRDPVFRPITIVEHATLAQVVAVRARQLEMPEVVVQTVPTRTYLDGLGAHLFGYVGEINDAQLDRGEFAGLEAGAVVGQTGIEKIYNTSLMGEDGKRTSSSTASAARSLGRNSGASRPSRASASSSRSTTTCSARSRTRFASRASRAPACSSSPETGEVLAMTSLPAYDPNDFATGIDPVKLGRAQPRSADAARKPAHPRHATRPAPRSRW